MAKTIQDVLAMIKEHDIKMVDFKMVDINGQYRHVTIPAQNFSEDTMKRVSVLMPPTTAMPWWKRAIWCLSPIRTPQ